MRNVARAIIVVILAFIASGCKVGKTPQPGEVWRCKAPPAPLEQADLVGIWSAAHGGVSGITDRIILNADGTYRQEYFRSSDGFDFTRDGEWWLERRSTGALYVHVPGMRRCDANEAVCKREQGGGGDELWYDICADRYIRTPGEFILMVVGVDDPIAPVPRGFVLMNMLEASDSPSHYYILLR